MRYRMTYVLINTQMKISENYLNLNQTYKEKTVVKHNDFIYKKNHKKGHHRILRQKLKKRHRPSFISIECHFGSWKRKINFSFKKVGLTPLLWPQK